jgi:hypothetical protein
MGRGEATPRPAESVPMMKSTLAFRPAVLSLCLACLTTGLVPAQGDGEQKPPVSGGDLPAPILKADRIKALSQALQLWFWEEISANDKQREGDELRKDGKTAQAEKVAKHVKAQREKARANKRKFLDLFAAEGKKVGGDLSKFVPDLLQIFDGCFPYPKHSLGGTVKEKLLVDGDKKRRQGYAVRFPKNYKPEQSWPLIFSLPARKSAKEWTSSKQWLETAWPKDNDKLADEFVVVCANLADDMNLAGKIDPTKDESQDQGIRDDQLNRLWMFEILNDVFQEFRLDTDRVFLEASGEAIPFALRQLTLFPDRFAGVILKAPASAELDDATVFDNFRHLPIAIVADQASKATAEALAKAIAGPEKSKVTVLVGENGPAFGDKTNDLTAWLAGPRRNLFPARVVLGAAHDKLRKAYWVEISGAEYLSQVPLSERPRVEVTADRKTNRIEVKAVNVSQVRLFLNDLLVDLDSEITLVLNGQVKTEKRSRSRDLYADPQKGLVVMRGDPRFIFVTQGIYDVPAPKKETSGDKPAEASSGDGAGKR